MLRLSTTSLLFSLYFFFFFNDTATTEIYTLSLHDALPISDDSIHTSEIFHSAISSSIPRVFLKSSPMDNLFFVTSASSPPWGRSHEEQVVHGDRKSTRLNSSH